MEQRELALDILHKTIANDSYSNLLMRKQLEQLETIQRAFVTNLVNGVLRNYEYLNYQFADEIRSSTSLRTRLILSMALYERFYLQEKDYVVNNEYAELGKNRYEKAFINALLHKINELRQPDEAYIRANLPKWIYDLLSSQYDEATLDHIIEGYQQIPRVYYRLNRKRAAYEDLNRLNISIIDEEIFTSKDNLLKCEEYQNGYFYVQDINSASLYHHLELAEGNTLLDVCSAPGSKLFNCLDILNPQECFSNDLHSQRVELIQKMAKRLGFDGINYLNMDGRRLKDSLDRQFDRIMLDAPCSGLGVIGRKPDLKFHIRPESLDELQKLQYELLVSMDGLLKKQGILLYSTCTLNRKENDRLIDRFLKENDGYVLTAEDTIINNEGDCFYYAELKKIK